MADIVTARIPFEASGYQFYRDLGILWATAFNYPTGSSNGANFAGTYGAAVYAGDSYPAPNSKLIRTTTSQDTLFTDDFGENAINTDNWDIFDGGLPANPTLRGQTLTQTAIGSGITGITDSISGSAITVTMGTTLGAERLYLSKQTFAGKKDIQLSLTKFGNLAENSFFVGFVEVDPTTLLPLLNTHIAADGNGSSEFKNKGGGQFGLTTIATNYATEAIGDNAPAKATGSTGTAASFASAQEVFIEVTSKDVIASTGALNAVTGKLSTPSRVSSQAPNGRRLYKLAIRARNTGTPGGSSTFTLGRILVEDHWAQRVEICGGEGNNNPQQGIPVNLIGTASFSGAVTQSGTWTVGLSAGSALIGKIGIDQTTPGTTNAVAATNLPTTVDVNSGNKSASTIRVVLATDQPALTNKLLVTPDSVALPANQSVNVNQIGGSATPVGHGVAATALRVELPTDGTGVVGLNAGANLIGKVGIDQTTPGTTDSVSVKSGGYSAAVSLTRTNDTNAYAANDVVGAATGSTAALTFALGAGAGEYMITSVALEIDAAAIISGETSYRLYLYNVTPPSALGDNAAWDLPSGDRASYLGYVDLGTVVDLGSTLYVEANGVNKQIKLASANVFGLLVTNGAYTPTASRVYVITLHSVAI